MSLSNTICGATIEASVSASRRSAQLSEPLPQSLVPDRVALCCAWGKGLFRVQEAVALMQFTLRLHVPHGNQLTFRKLPLAEL